MYKPHLIGALCAAVFSFITLPTQAALIGVLPATSGGTDWQAYYDSVSDLTWLADANAAVGSAYDTNVPGTGRINWVDAIVWAATLNIDGVENWRLPSSRNSDGTGPCNGANCTDSEMGNLYYNVLGNAQFSLTNPGPFSNVQTGLYWSSTEYAPVPVSAWGFKFSDGNQGFSSKPNDFYGWAVQSGNVGAAVVPVPAAFWLFGSGLLGLVGVARRKKTV